MIIQIHWKVLGLLCLSATIRPVELSSSVQEGEEEALKLWQKFCAGTTDQAKGSNSGGLFVFCSPTPLNDDVPEIDFRLNHDIKVSSQEKSIQTETVEVPKPTVTEIPTLSSVPPHRNRTRGRGGRRRLYYARKNTIEQQSKDGEQITRGLTSNSNESSTQISISSTQNETQIDSEVTPKDSRVFVIRKSKNKEEKDGSGRTRQRSPGRRRVAIVDVKPVSLFVTDETSTTEPNASSNL